MEAHQVTSSLSLTCLGLFSFSLSLSLSLYMRGGKVWFAVEAKPFEIVMDEKDKKLNGCIWECCKGVMSWITFGDLSLQSLLLGVEDCIRTSRKLEGFVRCEEDGR